MDMFTDFNENFDEIIKKFNLKPRFEITKEDGKIMVNEIWWSSRTTTVSANRIYEFDYFMIDIIPMEIRDSVLKEVLDIHVMDENYEEAAILRDVLLGI